LLDLYFRIGGAHLVAGDPEIGALSSFLRGLPIHGATARPDHFRNENGVYMKLQNLVFLDPDRTKTHTGLASVSALDRAVWSQLAGDRPRLRSLADTTRQRLTAVPSSGEGSE